MAISADPSSIPTSIYQNIQSNQPAKLEKIPNLFSKESNQMKILAEKETIYDVPQNNQLVKKLTLYEKVSRVFSNLYKRISNLFSRKPNQMEILEGKVKQLSKENVNLNLFTAQLQQASQQQYHYIYKCIDYLDACVHALKDMIDAKEAQIHTLEETISASKDGFCSYSPVSRSDSGFSEPIGKKHSLLSKAGQLLKTKIG